MQQVAHHLQMHAHQLFGPEKDAFARSSYNRYYYASYLTVRTAFAEITPRARVTHTSIQEILSGQITRKLKMGRERARKLQDHELLSRIDGAIRAVNKLKVLMTEAYATRTTADYEPQTLVNFTGERFSLNAIEVSQPHQWNDRTSTFTKSILDAWRQLND